MENNELKLAQKSAEHWQNIARELRSRLDEKESDNENLARASDVLRAQIDTYKEKVESPEYKEFLKQLAYDKELELDEYEGLRVQVSQMKPEELLRGEQVRLVKQIDDLSEILHNLQKLFSLKIAEGKVSQARGEQAFPEIAKNELRERIENAKS